MSGWDEGGVFYHNPNGEGMEEDSDNANASVAQTKFLKFIRNFLDNNTYIYRDQLRQRVNQLQHYLEVNMDDLRSYDEKLADDLIANPGDFMLWFENAAKEAVVLMRGQKKAADNEEQDDFNIQIILKSTANHTPIRNMKVPGIVISASRIQSKATHMRMVCRDCAATKEIPVKSGFQNITFPRICDPSSKCPPNSFYIVADKCRFVDQQTLKLQEAPEQVPTGEMPRHILLTVDRALAGRAVPGTRLVAIGIYTVMNTMLGGGRGERGSTTVRHAYLRVLGLETNESSGGRATAVFTTEEEREFRRMARMNDIYAHISNNIAPAIYGHEDIKKAIACQLLGGAQKHLPDRMRLRGDINLLLLGDPGTAKSQLLKFVEKVAPIGVYTSGKGSSAAGLTASVIRDPTSRDFYLEGGAMVLADGGVVCIDEFDKMNPNDRVAIHEAMEQQTISIAKAGITTILNSRTAVLAAANPVFGRYDDQRDAGENIDFKSTILSRFDLIFIVKDHRNEARDKQIAEHVIGLHMKGSVATTATIGDIPLPVLKRYIAFCRARCAPRLSADAAGVLQNYYVNIRANVRQRELDGAPAAVPITVRQLEAIVRLSESLAKMSLSDTASEQHVNEAIRLFNISTYDAVTSGVLQSEHVSQEVFADVQNAEKLLKRRLPIGSHTSERAVVADFAKQGLSEFAVRKAIEVMVRRDELEYRFQRKKIYRKR